MSKTYTRVVRASVMAEITFTVPDSRDENEQSTIEEMAVADLRENLAECLMRSRWRILRFDRELLVPRAQSE